MAGAKSELQEANRIQPNNPMTLQALAEVYRDSHDFDTAMEYADKLARLNDNNPSSHFLIATPSTSRGSKEYDEGARRVEGSAEGRAQRSLPS